jgi:glutathione S-transferase
MKNFVLVIGNKNYSSWSLRPWILMKYFKIPFEEIVIPLFQPGSKEKILKYSPAGKVPVLKHGDTLIWDSLAIAEYLAETFPKKLMWPKDAESRARARSVSAEMHSGFQALRSTCPMNVKARKSVTNPSPELTRDIERIKAIWTQCRQQSKTRGDFLFGPFTIADAMFVPVVFRFQTHGIPVDGVVQQYVKTILALPAVQEWTKAALQETWVIDHH